VGCDAPGRERCGRAGVATHRLAELAMDDSRTLDPDRRRNVVAGHLAASARKARKNSQEIAGYRKP
jgi:hypothetical protein